MLLSTVGSGGGSIGDSALGSLLGGAQKALLILFTGTSARKLKNSEIANLASEALLKSSADMTALAGLYQYSNREIAEIKNTLHFLEVQYNPNTLFIQANAEGVPILGLQQNLDPGVPNQTLRPPSVTLNVELFFDAVNLADSFMWEKFTLGLSGQTVSNIATLGASTQGYVWSVQDQTNGLLGAIMSKNTRFMIFKWADMTFAGELTEASAQYTMFSTSGRPVRSKVTLRITQNVESADDIKYWDNALDDATEDGSVKPKRSTLDSLQNLISFNF